MGIGTKIKEALHSDHSTSTNTHSNATHPITANHTTPGAFPSDDLPQRHADGEKYTAPHGTAVDDNLKPGTHTGATSGLTSSGTHRNRLSKGNDDQDQTKGAYWGDMSRDSHAGATGDLPDRTRPGEDSSAGAVRHHGTQGQHYDHHPTNQAVGGGVYTAVPAQGSHGASKRDPTEDSHFAQTLGGGSTSRDHYPAGHSSSAGAYNTGTGSGRPGHHDTVHDPLSSGSKGIPLSSGHTSGDNYDSQRTGFRGDGASTTHNNDLTGHSHSHGLGATGSKGIPLSSGHTSGDNYDSQRTGFRGDGSSTGHNDPSGHSHSHGLGATGAAAGASAAAAGYGAHEYGQHNSGNTSHHIGNKASDGVPRSSMLDPEPALNRSSPPTSGHSGPDAYNNADGIRGMGTGAHSNPGAHASHFAGGPSHVNTNIGAGPGQDASVSPAQSASSGSGQKHYGPGHEGAKVMHSCQHCGQDNDISHYFSKDVVYRLGQ